VEGVGKDSIPAALDLDLVDQMPRFTDEEAFMMCRKMARELGVMVGGSAGGNTHAALELARTLTAPACVVVILADSGTKYLSKIFNDEWMRSHGYGEDVAWDEFRVGSSSDTSIL
jgi:cystathionine beta-synthase